MGEKSRRKREKRPSGGTGRRKSGGEEDMRVQPTLQTLVICERVGTGQDGVHTLYRIVDKFNLRLEVHGQKRPANLKVEVPLNFVLFARFGAGVGRFRSSFELLDPDGQTVGQTDDNWFWLKSRENGHNIINNVSMPVKKSGPYKWLARLDGEIVGEYVFSVEFQQVFVQTGPQTP